MLSLGFRSSGRLPDGITGPGRRLWMAGGAADGGGASGHVSDVAKR